MLSCYQEKFALDDIYVQYLDRLGGDFCGTCSNITLLYHYINSERNISLTAKKVHMHRNSIIYRLQKIQDTLGMDLDDPEVRLRLMISFRILKMTGKLSIADGEERRADDGTADKSERIKLVE